MAQCGLLELGDERPDPAQQHLHRDGPQDAAHEALQRHQGAFPQQAGDTLGGIVEVRVEGVPFGLGTHAQWDLKLDGRIAHAVMAVQAIKGVEIGLGFEAARRPGSQVYTRSS